MDPAAIRILVAGVGPLPPEKPEKLFAPGLRLWGMARELARAGHRVRAICVRFGETERDEAPRAYGYTLEPSSYPELPAVEPLTVPADGLAALLAGEAELFDAHAAVGTTDVMNHALARSGLEIPIWMDFFGDPMAERQLLALRHQSDEGLEAQWDLVAPALTRADRLSGCSAEQCAALLGQLGAVGRLNRFTVEEKLVYRIAPWIEPIPVDLETETLVRGVSMPAEDYLIVQTGGFNTWLDVQTLFETLERVMDEHSQAHFACTGGAIPGHHQSGYAWFEQQVAQSPHRERYHLLGWLPLGQVPRLLHEADMGLNLDIVCAEGYLGTRNRLLDWLLAGLTVVSTPGCELACELAEAGHLTAVAHGDPEEAAEVIGELVERPRSQPRSRKDESVSTPAAEFVREQYDPARSLSSLLEWAADPKSASDLQAWARGDAEEPSLVQRMRDTSVALHKAAQQRERMDWLERRLARLEGSGWVKLALKLRGRDDLEGDPPPPES